MTQQFESDLDKFKILEAKIDSNGNEIQKRRTKTVVISDLHIESWYLRQPRWLRPDNQEVSKQEIFLEFCDHIKSSTARLVINGDLLDVPNFTSSRFYTPKSIHSKVIEKLKELRDDGIDVILLTGNHDYAFWAFEGSSEPLFKFRNPDPYERDSYLLRFLPKETSDGVQGNEPAYFIEHGHAYDPFLFQYKGKIYSSLSNFHLMEKILVKYPKLNKWFPDVFTSDEKKHMTWYVRMFVKGRGKGEAEIKEFYESSMRIWASRSKWIDWSKFFTWQGWRSRSRELWWIARRPWFWYSRILLLTTKKMHRKKEIEMRYFTSATKVFKALKYTQDPRFEIKGVMFGHTHLPDVQTFQDNGNIRQYINLGDWNEPTVEEDAPNHHASYLTFDEFGNPELSGNSVPDFIQEQGYKFIGHEGHYATERGFPSPDDQSYGGRISRLA